MSSTGYILNGKYIKLEPPQLAEDVNVTYKQYRHDQQRANHKADITQPYINGKINPEFEMLYPDQTRQMKEG